MKIKLTKLQKQNAKIRIDEGYKHFISRPKYKPTKSWGIHFPSGKRFEFIATEEETYKSYFDNAIAEMSLSTLETPRSRQLEYIDILIDEFRDDIATLEKLEYIRHQAIGRK